MNSKKEIENAIERRKFMRFDVPLGIRFKPTEDVPEYSSGTTINFSRHGFCFESDGTALPSSSNIEFNVQVPGKELFVPISGYVVWSQKVKNRFFAGIQIREMSREAKSDILEYCYDTWLETVRKRKMSSSVSEHKFF